MTAGGYIFMAIAWGVVLYMVVFSVTRLTRNKRS